MMLNRWCRRQTGINTPLLEPRSNYLKTIFGWLQFVHWYSLIHTYSNNVCRNLIRRTFGHTVSYKSHLKNWRNDGDKTTTISGYAISSRAYDKIWQCVFVLLHATLPQLPCILGPANKKRIHCASIRNPCSNGFRSGQCSIPGLFF